MFLKISQNSQIKHLCQSLFFRKVAGLRPVTLLKKKLWHRCFPANFVKFSRAPFLQNTFGRLLLLFCPSILSWNIHQPIWKNICLILTQKTIKHQNEAEYEHRFYLKWDSSQFVMRMKEESGRWIKVLWNIMTDSSTKIKANICWKLTWKRIGEKYKMSLTSALHKIK